MKTTLVATYKVKFISFILIICCILFISSTPVSAQGDFEKDVIATSAGDLEITFLGHGTLMFAFNGEIIHIDPFGSVADYAKLPKADMILISHEHGDHLDLKAISMIRTEKTKIFSTEKCAPSLPGARVLKNGESLTADNISIDAVPAYNLKNGPVANQVFHPKGQGNGYVLTFGDKRIYVAGDTENTPEMKALKNIDVAFLPMNLPYTMTPEMVADAVKAFKPGILYPYHFGETDTQKLLDLLKNEKATEVRIRKMK